MLEKLGQVSTDIREKMITDLTTFINKLILENNELILLIDANEQLTSGSGIARLYQNTNMIDPITLQHGYKHIPNTHQSGSQRIDFFLCTNEINRFITKCAITSFNCFSSSDHRYSYLDIQIKKIFATHSHHKYSHHHVSSQLKNGLCTNIRK